MGFYPIVRKTGTLYRKTDGDHGPYAEYKTTYMGVGLVPLMRATLGLILDRRWSQWALCQLPGGYPGPYADYKNASLGLAAVIRATLGLI